MSFEIDSGDLIVSSILFRVKIKVDCHNPFHMLGYELLFVFNSSNCLMTGILRGAKREIHKTKQKHVSVINISVAHCECFCNLLPQIVLAGFMCLQLFLFLLN